MRLSHSIASITNPIAELTTQIVLYCSCAAQASLRRRWRRIKGGRERESAGQRLFQLNK